MRSPLQLVWRRPRRPAAADKRSRSACSRRLSPPPKAYPCALSSPRSSRSRANSRWSRPTAKWRRSRKSDMVGRPISGSSKLPRQRWGRGARPLRVSAPRLSAAQSRERLPFAVRNRRPPRDRRACGRCGKTGTGRRENLYSAWIEKLFDAPVDVSLSWPALQDVLRDRSRNFLFNHLGLREDEKGLLIRPDCADLPYFLRAYFAFKLGLPFGYSKCTRGAGGKRPKCSQWWNVINEEPPPCSRMQTSPPGGVFGIFGKKAAPVAMKLAPQRHKGLVPSFGYYLRHHPCRRRSFRLGANGRGRRQHRLLSRPANRRRCVRAPIYADPYGHVWCSSKRLAQTDGAAACSSPSTGSPTARSRASVSGAATSCSRRTPHSAVPGFKRFRPIVARRSGGLRGLTNAEIAQESAIRRFLARAVEACGRGLLRPHGRRDVAGAARSVAGDEGDDHRARGAGEGARDVGGERPEVPDQRRRRGRRCRTARRSSRQPARGKISRRPRAICAC